MGLLELKSFDTNLAPVVTSNVQCDGGIRLAAREIPVNCYNWAIAIVRVLLNDLSLPESLGTLVIRVGKERDESLLRGDERGAALSEHASLGDVRVGVRGTDASGWDSGAINRVRVIIGGCSQSNVVA